MRRLALSASFRLRWFFVIRTYMCNNDCNTFAARTLVAIPQRYFTPTTHMSSAAGTRTPYLIEWLRAFSDVSSWMRSNRLRLKLKFHWDQFPRNFPVANVNLLRGSWRRRQQVREEVTGNWSQWNLRLNAANTEALSALQFVSGIVNAALRVRSDVTPATYVRNLGIYTDCDNSPCLFCNVASDTQHSTPLCSTLSCHLDGSVASGLRQLLDVSLTNQFADYAFR